MPVRKRSKVSEDNSFVEICHNNVDASNVKYVGRLEECRTIQNFIRDCLDNQVGNSMYLCGCPGTGKTECISFMLNGIQEWLENSDATNTKSKSTKNKKRSRAVRQRNKLDIVQLNANTFTSNKTAFPEIYRALHAQGAMSSSQVVVNDQNKKRTTTSSSFLDKLISSAEAEEVLSQKFKRKITNQTRFTLLVIDEIDQLLATNNQQVLYQLFEWSKNSSLILIGIANAVDLHHKFLPRLRVKNVEPELLVFSAYTKDELQLIIRQHLIKYYGSEQKLSKYFDDKAIEICARKIASKSGDARKAISLCFDVLQASKSCENADNSDAEGIKYRKIELFDMMKVMREAFGSPYIKTISGLPLHQKYALCSAVRLKKSKKTITLGSLHSNYMKMLKDWKLPPPESTQLGDFFSYIIASLESCGLMSASLKKYKNIRDKGLILNVQEDDIAIAMKDNVTFTKLLKNLAPPRNSANMHIASSK